MTALGTRAKNSAYASPRPRAGAALSPGAADYLRLAKPRVSLLLVFTAAVAAIVAGAGDIPWARVGLLVATGALACGGAGALNHYLERDIDSLMSRTWRRPLPAGRVAPAHALWTGSALLGSGLLLSAWLGPLTALFVGSGAAVYLVVYTWWLKRRSTLNIVVGGLAGSLAVLAGWSAVAGTPGVVALGMALAVFLWTPVHFWAFAIRHREEYARAGIPMLPAVAGDRVASRWIAVHCLLLLAVSLFGFRGALGPVYFVTAVPSGLALAAMVAWLNAKPCPRRGWATFIASNLYLAVLFAAILVDALV